MNILTLKKLASVATVACSLVFATASHAHLILVGHYELGGGLGNPAGEAAWIEGVEGLDVGSLTYLNKFDTDDQDWENDGDLDNPGYFDADIDEDVTDGYVAWDLTGSGFQLSYVLLKSAREFYSLYAVSDDQVITSDGWDFIENDVKNGISHVSFFGVQGTTSVPDSASTAMLLGLGVLAVSAAARRKNKS